MSEILPLPVCEGRTGEQAVLTLPALTMAGTVLVDIYGEASIDLDILELEAHTGSSGDIDLFLPEVSIAGHSDEVGNADFDLPVLEITVTGKTPIYASGTPELPLIISTSSATGIPLLRGNIELPGLSIDAHGYLGATGTAITDLPLLVLSSTGYSSSSGTLLGVLPLLEGEGVSHALALVATDVIGVTAVSAISLNIDTNAVSEYTNYVMNSLVSFNNQYLGASESGLFILSGDKDVATNISARVRTAKTENLSSLTKVPVNGYLGVTSNGSLDVSLVSGEGTVYHADTVRSTGSVLTTRRYKGIRGAKSRYWAIQVDNVSGSDFTLDELELELVPTTRRVK